ncbi:type VI secretion system Vgr family protein [Caldimonas brevitalea]|uniref:Type VI secretion system secreted protein VgrG n=1 Tax=Caldimonas brevitalea TaxID=413882 RepID=A0A0G3BJE0_9BURK|nr:type VI secretion system tip protein VgrG [Caldimonas brevitalea]AKJ29569.1 type VI secretion system secreted protein VgrG [Caldimonas brevitalea]
MSTRTFQLLTPLGADTLRFHRMNGREEMARLSSFEIDALSEREDLDPDQILGKKIAVQVELPLGGYRYFSGHATRFAQVGVQGRLNLYRLTMRPWLWFLTRTSNCRIFQQMKVPDILKQVFDAHADVAATSVELSGTYRLWDYCVQYRESDFEFVSRLMEQEGIYYYFRHEAGRHVLVLSDAASAHAPFPGFEQIPYLPHERSARAETEHIGQWSFGREIQTGRYVHDNYDPEKPRVELQGKAALVRGHAQAQYEVYDYPEKHLTAAEGEQYARVRIEELQSRFETAQGDSNARGLSVGHLFTLRGQPRQDQNREYLVLSATYQLEGENYESADDEGARFSCRFTALPSSEPFRAARLTRKPIVQGPQTAVVVGPAGEEIYTDEQGRVKVQFHWDRYSKGDENSSCWIRVSHPWAGKGWGAVSIPRIGQEVVVDFLEGDPDRPLITGRVYNAELMPPFAAPGMVSGMKSQTHKGAGFNEISMNDTAGKELMNIHAQFDQATTVQNNQTNAINNNRSTTVQVDDTLTVNANRTMSVVGKLVEKIDTGREVTVASGYTQTITGGATRTVTGGLTNTVNGKRENTVNGQFVETITSGEQKTVHSGKALTVTGGGYTEKVTGLFESTAIGPMKQGATTTMDLHADGAGTYTSGTSLKLGVGLASAIEITGGSITISSGTSVIKVDASGVSVNGMQISLNC